MKFEIAVRPEINADTGAITKATIAAFFTSAGDRLLKMVKHYVERTNDSALRSGV
jgi:hypothetical protein